MQLMVIGGGLAGAEACWQAAERGIKVELWEMRPSRMTPAHHTDLLAELVCSNSLRSNALENAVGVLKEEMRRCNSLIMRCADANRVPAGGALAVDRDLFARAVTKTLQDHPNVTIIREEVTEIPRDRVVIVASGPLTSEKLSKSIQRLTGERYFYFYDAAAPIVTYESINHQKVFRASRYGKGEAAYLNCPFTEEEYNRFYQELIKAERHPRKEFEKEIFFEGCMPVEVLAERGPQTLLFGPMKPVGLIDPRTGKQPYAVVQLRQDNREGTLYNIVGFQTNLKWGEQARVFRLIPGLENAEFVRYGVMHRNTFINSPSLLLPTLQLKKNSNIFFAGQITGVEGYVESASNGIVAGLNAARLLQGKEPLVFPRETVIGALCHYITSSEPQQFQPMNANFGLVPPFGKRFRNKREKNQKLAQRALNSLESFLQNIDN